MDHIDVIFYINLSHRQDRKEHMLNELKKLCNDESKIPPPVVRIDNVNFGYTNTFSVYSASSLVPFVRKEHLDTKLKNNYML